MKIWPFTRKSDTKAITPADLEELAGGGATSAGIYISPSDALRVPAVAAAVQLISEAVASLDVTIMRIEGSAEIDVPDHPALPLLRDEACEWVSGFEAIRQIVIDALTSDQGGMLWVNRVAGRPVELIRYNPGVLTFERDVNTSERLYRRFGSVIPARDVVHLLPPLGRAPLSLAREAIGTAVALDRHVAALFANGARPSGLLKIPAQGADQVKAAREVWNSTHGGQESGRTAVLINGTDFVPLTMTSTDGQHLENRRFQIEEIARAFNMSPVLLGDLTRSSYSNAEQKFKEFLSTTIEPWLRALEGAFRRALFSDAERADHVVRFDRDDASRADLATRATVISSLISSQVINPNNGRHWIGLPPREGGDAFLNPHISEAKPDQQAGSEDFPGSGENPNEDAQ